MTDSRSRWVRAAVASAAMTAGLGGAVPSAATRGLMSVPAVQGPHHSQRSIGARFAVAARLACAERGDPLYCELGQVTVEELTGGLTRYKAMLRVGPTPFDVIAITRIVREGRSAESLFLVHGSAQNFFDQYAKKSDQPDDPGVALWLAQRRIDVWGIDLRWALVPADTTEFAFMAPWDFQTDVSDVMLATRFARHVRQLTGEGKGKLNLHGFSNGASLVYAVANAEAVMPDDARDIKGLIPIETVFKLLRGHEVQRNTTCNLEAAQSNLIASGNLAASNAGAIQVGRLAQDSPDEASPFRSGYSNRQYALAVASALQIPTFPFHRLAVEVDETGIPVDGRFTPAARAFELLAQTVPFRNRSGARDYWGIPCGETDLPYDDHLAEIQLPVLYVGMAGGFGAAGLDTQSFLGSHDITTLMIQLLPAGSETSDFGHVDSLLANDAEALVWTPVLDWILAHAAKHGARGTNNRTQ